MFRDCARLERNMFVTWEKYDVDKQDVDERKECWERKKCWVISESYLSYIWVISESNLSQTWLACWLTLIITQRTC